MIEHLYYSPQAQLDLDEIYDYYAIECDDVKLASRIISKILSCAHDIPAHPTRFPPVGKLPFTQDLYRFAKVESYLIFFRMNGVDVYVDRILNSRRDCFSLLGKAEG